MIETSSPPLKHIDLSDDDINSRIPLVCTGLTTIKCDEDEVLLVDGENTVITLQPTNAQSYTYSKIVIIQFDPKLVINVKRSIKINNVSGVRYIIIKNAVFYFSSDTTLTNNKLFVLSGGTYNPYVTFVNCTFVEDSSVSKSIGIDFVSIVNCQFIYGSSGRNCKYILTARGHSSLDINSICTGNVFLSKTLLELPSTVGISVISNNYFMFSGRTNSSDSYINILCEDSVIENNIFVIADNFHVIKYKDLSLSNLDLDIFSYLNYLVDNLFLYINNTDVFPIYYSNIVYGNYIHRRFGETALFAHNNITNVDLGTYLSLLLNNFVITEIFYNNFNYCSDLFITKNITQSDIDYILNNFRSPATFNISSKNPMKASTALLENIDYTIDPNSTSFVMPVGISPHIQTDGQNQFELNYPIEDVVRKGIKYNFGLYEGKMIVPDERYVVFGVNYDAQGTIHAKIGRFSIGNYSTDIQFKRVEQE